MVIVDGQGVPFGGAIASVSLAEVKLAEDLINTIKGPRKGLGRPITRPKRIISDRVYDSNKLRIPFRFRKIHLIALHRKRSKERPSTPPLDSIRALPV